MFASKSWVIDLMKKVLNKKAPQTGELTLNAGSSGSFSAGDTEIVTTVPSSNYKKFIVKLNTIKGSYGTSYYLRIQIKVNGNIIGTNNEEIICYQNGIPAINIIYNDFQEGDVITVYNSGTNWSNCSYTLSWELE